jgi:hypothetical protein
MRYAARDEVFLPGIHWNALSVDDQGIATLHNDHVFVVIVSVCRGCRSFTAGPKRHLASACSIEYVTFDSWGRLIGFRDPVCRISHELGEIVHSYETVLHFQGRLTTLLRTRPVAASRCPAASCPFRSVEGILGNCPVGLLAIGVATDICRYRSSADRRHHRLVWVIRQFGDFSLKWIASGLAAILGLASFGSTLRRQTSYLCRLVSDNPKSHANGDARSIHSPRFPIAIPSAVPTPVQIDMLTAKPSGILGIIAPGSKP